MLGGAAWLLLGQPPASALLWLWAPWSTRTEHAADGRSAWLAKLGRVFGVVGLVLLGAGSIVVNWLVLGLIGQVFGLGLQTVGFGLVAATSSLQFGNDQRLGAACLLLGGVLQLIGPPPTVLRALVLLATAITSAAMFLPLTPPWLVAAVWAALGVYLVRTSDGPLRADASSWLDLARNLANRGTLLSGAAMAAVLSLALDWQVGLTLTLLLYLHELGHVAFAFARGVRVTRAPTFLPGLGAFVTTAPRTDAWDELWVSLGGPLVGGGLAIACTLAGVFWRVPWLTTAGDFAIGLNLLNLAPLRPLDGGKIVALTGPLGSLIGLVLAATVLLDIFNPIVVLFLALSLYLTYRAWREPEALAPWPTRIGVLAIYVLAFLALRSAQRIFGGASPLDAEHAELLQLLQYGALVGLLYAVLSLILLQRAFATRSVVLRYSLLTLFGWWWYAWRDRRWLPVLARALPEAIRPSPDAGRLSALAAQLAARHLPMTGGVVATGYDILAQRIGRTAADDWLDRRTALVVEAGDEAGASLVGSLEQYGYPTEAQAWLDRHATDDTILRHLIARDIAARST